MKEGRLRADECIHRGLSPLWMQVREGLPLGNSDEKNYSGIGDCFGDALRIPQFSSRHSIFEESSNILLHSLQTPESYSRAWPSLMQDQ